VSTIWVEASFAARVLILVALTLVLAAAYGVGLRLLPLWAILRAGLQLTVVALLLRGVLAAPWAAVAFVVLMLTTASLTSSGRTRDLWRGRVAAVLGVVAGALLSLGAIFALHLVALDARYLVAIGGIVIGSTMTAATLSGRNFLRASRTRAHEVEAWLSLGAPPSVAHRDLAREAVHESLIPNLDQAKSTGLVTLPGAFVGALFGGAGPVEAAKFQLVVLAGIALAMVTTSIVMTAVIRRTPYVLDTGA
jgi:putative ABC transport system permease protein